MCHGFTGNCSEHGLFDDFADIAADHGYYVVRFDFVGSGRSEGDFARNTNLEGWREDVLTAARYIRQRCTDIDQVITLGISLGAAAAIQALDSDEISAAVGWAPVLFPEIVFRKIVNEENWAKLSRGLFIHHQYAGESFDLAPKFLEDAEKADLIRTIRAVEKPVYLRLGTADPVIDPAFGEKLRNEHIANVLLEMVDGENHGFKNHEQENIVDTIDFLNRVVSVKA